MFKFNRAAILIAVFLSLAMNGCYTKIKSPAVRLVPDEREEIVQDEYWDFGWGWYDYRWSAYNDYYGYYGVAWWDECRWCDNDESPDLHFFNNEQKINRRPDDYIPQAHHIGQPGYNQPVSVEIQAPPGPVSGSRTIIQTKSTTGGSNDTGSDSSDDDNGKINRRGRK